MKKLMNKAVTILLCSAMLACPLHTAAETGDLIKLEIYTRTAPDLTVETESFRYSCCADSSIDIKVRRSLMSDLTKANYMVTGAFRYDEEGHIHYTLMNVNSEYLYQMPASICGCYLEPYLGDRQLDIGDLLYVEGERSGYGFLVMESNPPQLSTGDVTKLEYLGSGFDIFGSEFEDVARNELYLSPNYIVNDGDLYRVETPKTAELAVDTPADSEEEERLSQYVILDIDDRSAVLLSIGPYNYHTRFSGVYMISADCYIVSESTDYTMADLFGDAAYGDIVKYTGTYLDSTDGTGWNDMYPEDGTFEKIGSVFDTPLPDVFTETINGEKLVTILMSDGSRFAVGTDPDKTTFDNFICLPNMIGDADNSGVVDIVDVIMLNKYLLTGEALPDSGLAAMDVDGNGEVNATDSLYLLKYVVKIIDSFAVQ